MIKRRHFMQAVAAASAAPAALAQQSGTAARPAATQEPMEIDLSVADTAAEPVPRFFSGPELSALRRLSDILMPEAEDTPGALAAGAPEFLDFLLSESPPDRQDLYRTGLGALNLQAALRFNKPFSEVESSEADALLAPLREPWSPEPPADPLARFLLEAKGDVRTATLNSREWAEAVAEDRRRRRRGSGTYWYTVE